MANYSQSGHEFVDVEMQDSMSEMEQSFSNPLLGVPGTSSAFGSVLTTTQNSARNEHVQDVQSSTLASTTKKAENEPEVALEHLPEVNDKQINNASEEVVGKAVSGAQNTCNQVPTSENAVSSDSETGIELPVGHNALLLKRCNKQSESLRKYKKKINDKDTEIAQLKDLVVHAVSEAKAAKEDPNAKEVNNFANLPDTLLLHVYIIYILPRNSSFPTLLYSKNIKCCPKILNLYNTYCFLIFKTFFYLQTFTPDVNLNITTADIENINALSKNVGVFAQNLAIHLYGADELCKRSVTGRNYKGTSNGYEPKPALSPTKLDFIYSKYQNKCHYRSFFSMVYFYLQARPNRGSHYK